MCCWRVCPIYDCSASCPWLAALLHCKVVCFIADSNIQNVSSAAVVSGMFDKNILRSGQLTDQHVDMANNMIKQQYPHMQGLETPLLSQTSRGFSILSTTRPAMQIHHVRDHCTGLPPTDRRKDQQFMYMTRVWSTLRMVNQFFQQNWAGSYNRCMVTLLTCLMSQ